ncbi:MAG: preprotein translocase subunit SecE [Lachnospiraceae bacterium]|nr:preprotein translocase subunit SecE [Lachnospiraceae bacterium]
MAGYFKSVKAEFKKIIWPGKADALKQSLAVVVVSICLGLAIALIDAAVKYGLGFIL